MEAGKESQLPETNGELEQQRESERAGEETMDESTEDRESDLDESEEQEEEESSGKSAQPLLCRLQLRVNICHFHPLWQDMDDEDCERRRGECLDEMLELEKQFQAIKEK